MKRRLNLTIDDDVYDMIKELPRKVSVSEFISFVLRGVFEELKRGKSMTDKEVNEWIESDPELRDFRERLIEHWGPSVKKFDASVEKIKGAVKRKIGRKTE